MVVDGEQVVALAAIGWVAGTITTWAGVGGGFVATLILSVLWGPMAALGIMAPALLFGNIHRQILFRKHLDKSNSIIPVLFAAGFCGALFGSWVAGYVPEVFLLFLIAFVAFGSLVKERFGRKQIVSRQVGVLGVGAAGIVGATTGGGGFVLGPVLFALDIRDDRFIAMASLVAIGIHIGRMLGYAGHGFVTATSILSSTTVAAAIVVGNFSGKLIRRRFGNKIAERGTYALFAAGGASALYRALTQWLVG